ncbi:hypothetical protein RFI_25017, partial [Reticulomyxa filosa]
GGESYLAIWTSSSSVNQNFFFSKKKKKEKSGLEELKTTTGSIDNDSPMAEQKEGGMDTTRAEPEISGSSEWHKEYKRRRINRPELYKAPNSALFRFLQELISRVKFLPDMSRITIYRNLLENDLLDCLSACIQSRQVLPTNEYSHIWLVVVETLYHLVSTPINLAEDIRAHISKHVRLKSPSLLDQLCRGLSAKAQMDSGLLDQMQYVLRLIMGMSHPLLMVERLHSPTLNQRKVIEYFFNKCLQCLIRPLRRRNRYKSRRRFSLLYNASDNNGPSTPGNNNNNNNNNNNKTPSNKNSIWNSPSHHSASGYTTDDQMSIRSCSTNMSFSLHHAEDASDPSGQPQNVANAQHLAEYMQSLECLRLQQKYVVQILIQCIEYHRDLMKRFEERFHVMKLVHGLVDLPTLQNDMYQNFPNVRMQF